MCLSYVWTLCYIETSHVCYKMYWPFSQFDDIEGTEAWETTCCEHSALKKKKVSKKANEGKHNVRIFIATNIKWRITDKAQVAVIRCFFFSSSMFAVIMAVKALSRSNVKLICRKGIRVSMEKMQAKAHTERLPTCSRSGWAPTCTSKLLIPLPWTIPWASSTRNMVYYLARCSFAPNKQGKLRVIAQQRDFRDSEIQRSAQGLHFSLHNPGAANYASLEVPDNRVRKFDAMWRFALFSPFTCPNAGCT